MQEWKTCVLCVLFPQISSMPPHVFSLSFAELNSKTHLRSTTGRLACQTDQRRAAELFDELDEHCHGAPRRHLGHVRSVLAAFVAMA